MNTLLSLCTSAFPKLTVFVVSSASVSIVTVSLVVFVFVFALTTEAEIVARTFNLLPLNVLPKSIVSVLPVGDPPRDHNRQNLKEFITSPTSPSVALPPFAITETVTSASECAVNTSFVPVTLVLQYQNLKGVTNCLLILKLVSLMLLLSAVNNVLTTYGSQLK